MDQQEEDNREFCVLVNDEGQYSLWPAGKAAPTGWTAAGHSGSKSECMRYVDSVWTDMRPRSARAERV
jgi:MbtH protein